MTGNVSSHLPPSRRRITRFIANMARNLASTRFDLPHAAAIESARRSGTPPSHWAEGQANHAPETGLFFSAPLFHSFPWAPRRCMQSKPCDDDRCDAIRWENMAAARSEGFHVLPSSFFRCVVDAVMGHFPFGSLSPLSVFEGVQRLPPLLPRHHWEFSYSISPLPSSPLVSVVSWPVPRPTAAAPREPRMGNSSKGLDRVPRRTIPFRRLPSPPTPYTTKP